MKLELEKKKPETKKNSTKYHSQDNPKERKQFNAYVKYSALGFQMMAMLGIGVWSGIKLDEYFDFHKPVFLIVMPLVAIISVLVVTIKSLPKD